MTQPLPAAPALAPGTFKTHRFSSPAGERAYKLYVPRTGHRAALPLVVMLHGCTQSANDFATATRMNRLADMHGFLVVYPKQSAYANMARCWNWFNPPDPGHEAGEPALIAGIVRKVVRNQHANPRRVFIVGLSAGAAMAVVMGETYPALFAGVGAHSGLAYGSANDLLSALAAMKGRPHRPQRATQPMPTIVFHGDRDRTVQHSNAQQLVQQARTAHSAQPGQHGLSTREHAGEVPDGRKFSRTVHADEAGQARVESWTLHGGGHAWSGGDQRVAHTDPSGPDASAEMVRFFLALPVAEPRTPPAPPHFAATTPASASTAF